MRSIRVEGPPRLNPTANPPTKAEHALACQAARAQAHQESQTNSTNRGSEPPVYHNLGDDRKHLEDLLAQAIKLNDEVQTQLSPILGPSNKTETDPNVNTHKNMMKWLQQFRNKNVTKNLPGEVKLPYSHLPPLEPPPLNTKDAERLLSLLEAHASTLTNGGAHLARGSIHSQWWIRAPLTEALRSGLEDLEKDKEKFFSDMAQADAVTERGSLADSMVNVLVHTLTTSIAVKGTDILSYELGPRIAASMIASLEANLGYDLKRMLTQSVSLAVGKALTHTIGNALIGLLPTYLTQVMADSLTAVLGRGLTHSLAPSLAHTLTFYDDRDQGSLLNRRKRMHGALYYAEAYGRYYSDYFSDLYAGYMHNLDFKKDKFSLWKYHPGHSG